MQDTVQAERQYTAVTKWANTISQVSSPTATTTAPTFRVMIIGTHVDKFPDNCVPSPLREHIAESLLHLVGPHLGNHLIRPDNSTVPYFEVSSVDGTGLTDVSASIRGQVGVCTLSEFLLSPVLRSLFPLMCSLC